MKFRNFLFAIVSVAAFAWTLRFVLITTGVLVLVQPAKAESVTLSTWVWDTDDPLEGVEDLIIHYELYNSQMQLLQAGEVTDNGNGSYSVDTELEESQFDYWVFLIDPVPQ